MLQTTFLYYLVQVAHYQSLSIAAEELHVSQPALSTGIKKLEEQLGVKLLERTYKGVTLTDEGKEVVALAEKAFGYLDEIETKFQQHKTLSDTSILDDLIIYCNPAYSHLVLSAILAYNKNIVQNIQLLDLTPDINVQQLVLHHPNICVLGIVSDVHEVPDSLIFTKIHSSQAYISCTEDFPYIAPTKSTISFKELARIPLAVLNNSFEFQKILLNGIRQYSTPNTKVVAPNVTAVSSAIQSGIAAGFHNKFFSNSQHNGLRYLPIRNAPKFHLSLVSHQETDQKKILLLAQLLKEIL